MTSCLNDNEYFYHRSREAYVNIQNRSKCGAKQKWNWETHYTKMWNSLHRANHIHRIKKKYPNINNLNSSGLIVSYQLKKQVVKKKKIYVYSILQHFTHFDAIW